MTAVHDFHHREAKHEPDDSFDNPCKHVGQIVDAEINAAKADQRDERHRNRHGYNAPPPTFRCLHRKRGEQTVKYGRRHRVAAWKAIAGEGKEGNSEERAGPVHNVFYKNIDKHSARHGKDERQQTIALSPPPRDDPGSERDSAGYDQRAKITYEGHDDSQKRRC